MSHGAKVSFKQLCSIVKMSVMKTKIAIYLCTCVCVCVCVCVASGRFEK